MPFLVVGCLEGIISIQNLCESLNLTSHAVGSFPKRM